MGLPSELFYNIRPPTVSTYEPRHQVLSAVSGAAAANYDWNAALVAANAAPEGSVMVRVEASSRDTFIRFKPTATHTALAAAGTTATNGLLIKADQPGQTFYVNPLSHGTIDFIAPAGAGTIQIQVSSPIGTRNSQ